MKLKDIWELIRDAFKEWSEDKASRLAAALSYYTIFSLAPLLIIVIAVAGFFWGEAAVEGRIFEQIQGLVGTEGAQMIETMIAGASEPTTGIVATIISVVLLLFAASGLFGQLQDSLNVIWEVQPKPGRGIMSVIKTRFLSFTMVLGVAFLLLVSLLLSAALAAISEFFTELLPGSDLILQILTFVISFGVITLLFAMIYKVLPDAEIAWGDVWLGAAVTALLFTIGKELIGLYLGRAAVGSTYGAAGSLVIILLWVFYSAQILFFGAEFTQVYANRFGSRIRPAEHAMRVTEEVRARQGIPHRSAMEAAAGDEVRKAGPEPARRYPRRAQEGYGPGMLRPLRTPAEKSMAALAGLAVALIGFVSTSFIRRRRS